MSIDNLAMSPDPIHLKGDASELAQFSEAVAGEIMKYSPEQQITIINNIKNLVYSSMVLQIERLEKDLQILKHTYSKRELPSQ